MLTQTSPSRLTLQMVLTLILTAVMITTALVWLSSPSLAVSASDLPAIQSPLQANYGADSAPFRLAPLNLQGFEVNLP